ncbi:MAG: ppk2 [Caulobacter sp.]|nr:ppk2 [Caulobacter sp.]
MTELTWEEYEVLQKPLIEELGEMARWVDETGQRVLVLFEGRDTAGKGGSIFSISRTLNPRQCRVVALPSPNERERGQWYFQRYVEHLPAKGEIVLFDRSWYNRAGVERVMGFCTEQEAQDFLAAVPEFERQLVNHGIILVKYWLACDQEKQEERLANRLNNPLKRWKLSPIDLEARTKYDAYTRAREDMLKATHTEHAPWTVIDFNSQEMGRLTLLRDLLDRVPDTKLPLAEIEWPPLANAPLREQFDYLQPLPDYKAPED